MAIAEPPARTQRVAESGRRVVALHDRASDYARAVVAGEYVVGRYVRLACERHLDDLERGHERGLRWDVAASERAIDFFRFLNHFEGPKAGTPILLEPWQCFMIGPLFGWLTLDAETGKWLRRFRRAFDEVAKKNGKSTIFGGLGLLLAFFDDQAGAQVYSMATKRDQAKILWHAGKVMVEQSPELRTRILTRALSLYDPATASSFKPLGKDSKTEDGINPSALLVDELHRMEDRELVDVGSNSMGARENALIGFITTSGAVGISVWAEEHDYAVKVLEGVLQDDALFALIYNLDEGDDPFDERNWPKANPNLGVSVRWDDMRQQAREAKEKPGALNDYLRLRLNVRTSTRLAWFTPDEWAATDELPAEPGGRLAYGGLDLGSRVDLAAFIAVAEDKGADDEAVLDVYARFWCPEEGIDERSRRDRVPYREWVDEGWITATPGDVTDYDRIREEVGAVVGDPLEWEHYGRMDLDLWEVGFDPHDATQLSTQLLADGIRMFRIMQSTTEFNAAVVEVERMRAAKPCRLRVGANPVLAWMVNNTVMVQDAAGRRRPDKEKAREKIDGVPALLMAVKRWMANAGSETEWGPA